MSTFLCFLVQKLWLYAGRKAFFWFSRNVKTQSSQEDFFSDSEENLSKMAQRDLSYFSRHIDFSEKKVLDVGCGIGRKTAHYSTVGMDVIGLDIYAPHIKNAHSFAKSLRLKNVDFLAADAAHLPFKQESLDIAISTDALEHVKNCSGTVIEMKRVVKERGHVCISFGPLWRSPFGSHVKCGDYFCPPWIHLIFSEESIKDVLISYGKIEESARFFSIFGHVNRVSLKEFQKIVTNTKLKVLFFKTLTQHPFEFLLRTPLREFFVTQVVTLLEK